MNLVTRIEFGSHLYGTNTATSDHDYKGVRIPSAEEILLQRVKDSTGHQVIRPEGERNTPEDTDDETYSLQAYLKLLAEGQTVAIDMLFAPKPIVTTPLWEHIKENRRKLLTKKSASFLGYCRTQANKYGIKGSRVSAAKKAMEFFGDGLAEFGPLAKVGDLFDLPSPEFEDEHTRIITKETTQGHYETYFECCNRMVGFKNTLKEARSIYTRIYEEYGKRARLAEANEGIDWKALSHAVRVGYEAIELLQTANVTFPLPYAQHILDIKLGKKSYKEVAEEIEQLLGRVEYEAAKSDLLEEPDYEWIDKVILEHYGYEVGKYFDEWREKTFREWWDSL